MLYSLGSTGKVVDISLAQFLTMSDEEFAQEVQDLQAWDYGNAISNPFHMSCLNSGTIQNKENIPNEDEPVKDITEIDYSEKFKELGEDIDFD